MQIDLPIPHVTEGDPALPARPILTEQERQAEMERLSKIARSIEDQRRAKELALTSSPFYEWLIGAWEEFTNGYPESLTFSDFMYWLRRINRESDA